MAGSGRRSAEISMRDAEADAAEWERVSPAYTDTIGDTAFRNQISFQSEYRYQNSSGRNDLDTAKVTQDSEFLYFHITTVNEIVAENDEVWMNLYLDIDNDPSTGWEGYDLILNRSRDGETVSVERFVDNGWKFETIGSAEYLLGTNSLTIKAAKEVIRKAAPNADFKRFAFKWADASVSDGDVMRFMDLGDTGAERPVSISLYHREASGGENGRAPVLDHGAVYLPGRGRIAGLRRRLLLRTKAEEIKI